MGTLTHVASLEQVADSVLFTFLGDSPATEVVLAKGVDGHSTEIPGAVYGVKELEV